MISPYRPIVVSLTAIPPRFPNLIRKIASLLKQTVLPTAIEIYIPKSYRRFPTVNTPLPELPKIVTVIHVDDDLGPATKLLPALDKWRAQDVDILICDDDRLQDPDWIARFAKERLIRPNDIICERGWNIDERLGLKQFKPLMPRALQSPNGGRSLSYRLKRALSFGLIHPKRSVYECSGYVDIFEGFLGALIPPRVLPFQAWDIPEILWTVDDVWLSGMAKLNNVGVWAHNHPRPVSSNGKWDKVDALTDWVEGGADRKVADKMCVEYIRNNYGVWL
jgi:hypothetical protein